MIDLKQEVISPAGNRYLVSQVELTPSMHNREEGKTINVSYPVFIDEYVEYIDPKDVEIARLSAEIQKLKDKAKKPRKTRKRLLPGEIKDIKADIIAGSNNMDIAREYEVSDSSISKYRIELRKEGKDV